MGIDLNYTLSNVVFEIQQGSYLTPSGFQELSLICRIFRMCFSWTGFVDSTTAFCAERTFEQIRLVVGELQGVEGLCQLAKKNAFFESLNHGVRSGLSSLKKEAAKACEMFEQFLVSKFGFNPVILQPPTESPPSSPQLPPPDDSGPDSFRSGRYTTEFPSERRETEDDLRALSAEQEAVAMEASAGRFESVGASEAGPSVAYPSALPPSESDFSDSLSEPDVARMVTEDAKGEGSQPPRKAEAGPVDAGRAPLEAATRAEDAREPLDPNVVFFQRKFSVTEVQKAMIRNIVTSIPGVGPSNWKKEKKHLEGLGEVLKKEGVHPLSYLSEVLKNRELRLSLREFTTGVDKLLKGNRFVNDLSRELTEKQETENFMLYLRGFAASIGVLPADIRSYFESKKGNRWEKMIEFVLDHFKKLDSAGPAAE